MISNSQALEPTLDSAQLRQLADRLNVGESLEELVEQWSFNNSQELLATSARSMRLEWLESDDCEVASDTLAGFPAKLIHRHSVFPIERGSGCPRSL